MAHPDTTTDDLAVLTRILGRLEPEVLLAELAEAYRAQVPGSRDGARPEAWTTAQEITRLNLETFSRIILQRRSLADDDLAPFRAAARDRASADVPLEDLLHACRTGGRLVWQRVTAEARPDEQAGLVAGADLIMEYLDSVSSAIAQAYLDERQHLVSEEDRKLRDLLEALSDPTALPAELAALAKEMSLPVLAEYRPFAVIMRDGGPRDHGRIAKALRARGVLALTEGRRIAGLVDPERARGLIGQPAVIALGDPTQRGELSDALDEVRRLADLGRALGEWGELRPSQYLPELLLSASPRLAERLRRKAIGPLETYADRRGTDLLETLAAFVTNQCDRRATASALHVHPNTVDYRLGRVEELTGLSLGRPGDLLLLTLALTQRELDRAAG